MKYILELDDVNHAYDDKLVLSNINLKVAPSEIVCLLGQSGCGKTTTLRAIAGFEKIKSGKIILKDQIVSSQDKTIPPEKRNIGVVFQNYVLFPHLNVFKNILFGLSHLTKDEAEIRAYNLMSKLDISHLKDKNVQELSGGEQQRVALARALAPKPEILLMDEPFSNLDRSLREKMKTQIVSVLRDEQSTVIWVTHDQWEAFDIADRIAVMKDGKIAQLGNAQELYTKPSSPYVAEFVGDGFWMDGIIFCESNQWMVKTEFGSHPTIFSEIDENQLTDQTRVRVFIRPEQIEINPQGLKSTITEIFYRGHDYHLTAIMNNQTIKFLAPCHFKPSLKSEISISLSQSPLNCFLK
jgi:iron(III) transport system ATP-binding protein